MSQSSPTPAASDKNPLAWLYLTLAIAGAVLTWQANLAFMQAHGKAFDLGLFVRLANANPAAQSLSRDLAVAATAFTVWMVACGGPLFLYLRERRLMEMGRTAGGLP
jgi:hypothetical protein